MSKIELICRFCLKIPGSEAVTVDEVTKQIFESLQIQLDFDVFEDTVMCKDCSDIIERLYSFKSACEDTHDFILLSQIQDNKSDIDLRSIYEAKTNLTVDQDAEVCRLCMKPNREDELISVEALNLNIFKFTEMWTKYMTEVNLNVTRNPKVCIRCKDNLQCYFKFVTDLGTVEEKINAYRERIEGGNNKPILFIDALKYLCVDSFGYSNGFTQMCTIKTEDLKDISINSSGHEIHIDDTLKQESIGNSDDDIPKVNEIYIKEENVCDENFDKKSPCICGICVKCNTQCPKIPSVDIKMHECTICDYKAKYKRLLNKHIALHHGKESKSEIYKCDRCEYETNWKGNLKKHVLIHGYVEVPKYTCDVCPYFSNYMSELRRHGLVHKNDTEVEIFECAICGYKTKRKNNLRGHMVTHKNRSQLEMYKCQQCSYESYKRSALARHAIVHKDPTEIQMYRCTQCDFATKHKHSLKEHGLMHSKGQKMYSCEFCTFQAEHQQTLECHKLSHKGVSDAEIYKCSLCDFETRTKRYIYSHRRSHREKSEIKAHKCSQCAFETNKKSDLTRHIGVKHKNEDEVKIYNCTVCSYKTKYKFHLSRHSRLHETKAGV